MSNRTDKVNSGNITVSRYITNSSKSRALITQSRNGVKQHIALTVVPTIAVLSNLLVIL